MFFFSLFISTTILASSNVFDKNIDFKEGVVHYRVSGSEIGTKTLYLKDYGRYKTIYTNTKSKFMRGQKTIRKITYITPKYNYEVDLKNNTATKLPNLKYLLQKKLLKLPSREREIVVKNFKKLKDRSILNLKGLFYPKAKNILGYVCNRESIKGITTYTAKNSDLVLETKANILGFNSNSSATKIEKKQLDSKIFEISKKLTISPTPQKVRELEKKAEEIISYLQNPDIEKTKTHQIPITQKEDFQNIIQESIKALEAL
jgi:hypothetical protein